MVEDVFDHASVEDCFEHYQAANVHIDLRSPTHGVLAQWWRSVGHTHTAVAKESAIDELAVQSKTDPYEFRYQLRPAVFFPQTTEPQTPFDTIG